MIIMDWILGQSNPSNYFALTLFLKKIENPLTITES